MKHIYLILHWMNFDTALGAAVTSLFIANILNTIVPQVATLALILVVLAIYNFDHLLDAKKISGVAVSGRHRFYQRYFTQLAIYQVLLLTTLLIISWFVPATIAQGGIILAVITLIYFILLFIVIPNHFAFKELMIATVFTCGLFLAPFAVNSSLSLSLEIILLWIEIFLLALMNTLIFSWLDYNSDKKEGHSSLAQIIGSKMVRILSFIIIAILAIFVVISLAIDSNWVDQLIIAAMGLVLFICLMLGKQNKQNERLRITGEAIFLMPLMHIIF